MSTTRTEPAEVTIRALKSDDLDPIVRIDARVVGRTRRAYHQVKLEAALREGVNVGLAAELHGTLVGFLMGTVYYGEFGQPEPVAVVDTLGVHPDFWGRGIGRALWEQFLTNLKGLRVTQVQTQVDWNNWALLRFFERVGFRPSTRLCLTRGLDPTTDD